MPMQRASRSRSKKQTGPNDPWWSWWATSTTGSIGRGARTMMHTAELLKVFAEYRRDAIVVPGRGGRHWIRLTTHEMLDVPLGDPAMGGHAGFALGLALAQPNRRVVLFDSEGDILMSLGMLTTVAEQAPANFYHFLLDNECYAT